jgi:ribonuclease BN (tRNA processing enzyme)
MKLTFLGTGGGRHVVISQLRATGGFLVEEKDLFLHVDPGPGALARARQFKKDLRKVNAIFVSHAHPDHYTELEMVIEAMTLGAKEKRGVLMANEYIFRGEGKFRRVVSDYHKEIIGNYFELEPQKKAEFDGTILTATRCSHAEDKCIGFVLEKGAVRLGYTADGAYFEGQESQFQNCDCLILNCLRPRNAPHYGHMNADDARILIERSAPKLAILQHLGMKMLFGAAEREAAWIAKETGVRTIAAKDGQSVDIGGENFLGQRTLR